MSVLPLVGPIFGLWHSMAALYTGPGVKIPTGALSKATSEIGRKNGCISTTSVDLGRGEENSWM